MENIKIVTICGSMRFKKQMMKITEELELENGYVVIQCVYSDEDRKYEKSEKEMLSNLHYKKINMSDAIYVVNIDGYIGDATKKEIDYARSLGKIILSLEPLKL